MDWSFLFKAMGKLGFSKEFVDMTNLLFHKASTTMKVNGSQFAPFCIERWAYQGCPLAPHLNLIIAKVLNAMVKEELEVGQIQGIKLLIENRQ